MVDRKAVVIGAGISGVLVARELLRAGWQVEVLEARHVGAGSSSRTAAGIRQQFSTPSTVRGMRYAVQAYLALGDELGARCLVQGGYLFLHGTADAGRAALGRVAVQRAAGLDTVQVLEGPALVERFPWVDPDTCVGGTFDPTDGFLLPAVVYTEGARRVRELGGTLRVRAPVTGARHAGGRLVAVTTPDGGESAAAPSRTAPRPRFIRLAPFGSSTASVAGSHNPMGKGPADLHHVLGHPPGQGGMTLDQAGRWLSANLSYASDKNAPALRRAGAVIKVQGGTASAPGCPATAPARRRRWRTTGRRPS